MTHVIIRPSAVYGELDVEDRVISKFLLTAMRDGIIKVNGANETLDFTYVDDIIEGVYAIVRNSQISDNNYRLFNIGNNSPEKLLDFIGAIEKACNKKAILKMYPMQDGDVYQTFADISALNKAVGYAPTVNIEKGIRLFVSWYKDYYGD